MFTGGRSVNMIKDFLYLENDVVKISEQAMALPESKAVWNMDKHKGKPFFNNVITFTFYMYHPESIYRNLDSRMRKSKIIKVHFPGLRYEIDQDQRVKDFIDTFNMLSKTQKERILDTMIKDLEDMMDHLAKIEFQKRIDEVHTVFVKCPAKGEEIPVDVKVKKVVDNSQEKMKAMKLIEDAMEREEALRKKVEKERLMSKLGDRSNRRKFDR